MKALDGQGSTEVNEFIGQNIAEESIVFRDKSESYLDIANYAEVHVFEKSTYETSKTTLQCVHIAINNAKRILLGRYHKIKGTYLQLCLNEFCYKLNRTYFMTGYSTD